MAAAQLVLHRGAREVDRGALALMAVPEPSKRWFPIGHHQVVTTVNQSLLACGFEIRRERYAVTPDNGRLFGTLDIGVELAPQITLAVGIRNSIDQTFPLGFCAGHRVFVCDNLAFSAELMVRRKHTRFGHDRFRDDIGNCVAKLEAFRQAEAARIARMRETELSDTQAESLILRAMYDQKIVSHRLIPRLMEEWRDPTHEAFQPRTLWSLFNTFTHAMADRAKSNPQAYAQATMKLQALCCPKGGDGAALTPPSAPPDGIGSPEPSAS